MGGRPAGPYGVVFLAADLKLLSVLALDVSGYILLSKDVVSLEANFYAGANFLDLAQWLGERAPVLQLAGRVQVMADGNVQLGPDWINIHGSADLTSATWTPTARVPSGDWERNWMSPEAECWLDR